MVALPVFLNDLSYRSRQVLVDDRKSQDLYHLDTKDAFYLGFQCCVLEGLKVDFEGSGWAWLDSK